MGGTSDVPFDIRLPTDLTPGNYYLIVVANYDRSVNETDFNNNASINFICVNLISICGNNVFSASSAISAVQLNS